MPSRSGTSRPFPTWRPAWSRRPGPQWRGCGSTVKRKVGLATIATAQLYTPGRIIAVDLAESRLDAARSMGADAVVSAAEVPEQLVRDLTDGLGADVVVGAVGVPETFSPVRPAPERSRRCRAAPSTTRSVWPPGGHSAFSAGAGLPAAVAIVFVFRAVHADDGDPFGPGVLAALGVVGVLPNVTVVGCPGPVARRRSGTGSRLSFCAGGARPGKGVHGPGGRHRGADRPWGVVAHAREAGPEAVRAR
ncbi:zinc-binding dehydrogenase [Streptomyces roseolus]|uniref:zinc-binding dehydrogenase n=1 Tax=Streptomyces roseolus TaxID=67358 RepID=UPI0037B1747B